MPLFAIILISFLGGFGGGWLVKDWKDGAEVAVAKSEKKEVESHNAILTTANDTCKTDIDAVQKGVVTITEAVAAREQAAVAAMATAQDLADRHKQAARQIQAAPSRPAENQCNELIQEQIDYVKSRRTDS
jgi:hypothetical protein